MKKINVSFLLIFFFVITASFSIRAQNNTMERLGIPGPISFDGTKYNFLRALNQNEGSYYQEYVPDKETTDNYNQMLIYKLFFSDWSVREFAENKMHQIEQFKNTDSISTSRMFHNADSSEWIVDYFLGEYTNDKKLSGVDYYIYRYKKIKLGYDSNAILAFVYNRHSNGKDPVHFLEEANKQKNYYLYKIGSTELPKIKLQPQKDLYLRDPEKVKGYSSELTASQQKAMDDFLAGTSFNNNHQYLQEIEKFKQAIKTDSTGNCGTHMSGTAYGTVILHVAPESAAGGPLSKIKSGDIIDLDVAARTINVKLSDAELNTRPVSALTEKAYANPDRGWQRMYIDHVMQADTGADLDFLIGSSGQDVTRESL